MPKKLNVAVELGPKGKKFAAVATEWPGLERSGKSPEEAIENLKAYLPRYNPVAKYAHRKDEFTSIGPVQEIERYVGTGSTDFWGISFAFSNFDRVNPSDEELEREIALMRACWRYFDEVRSRVSPDMRPGPRGGGRSRDRIVRHTLGVEQDWAKKLGIRIDDVVIEPKELASYRNAYCRAIRSLRAEGRQARTWPLRYLIRHTAYHVLDHTWEMQDKDLSD